MRGESEIITTAHGGGGAETTRLINEVFAGVFGNDTGADAAVLELTGRLAFTTDSYVVRPLFFKGGDIGRLAVCGTVNDLLTSGAVPRFISAGFVIEEGASTRELKTIARSMRAAADEAGVSIVTGDTKVIEGAGGVYINTAGVGEIAGEPLNLRDIRGGDKIIVTGALGNHHACIISCRMGIDNDIKSDATPLTAIAAALRDLGVGVRGMRDITRGGIATCLNEIAELCDLRAVIREADIPIDDDVRGLCDILGLDPLYMANEGKMLIVVTPEDTNKAIDAIRGARYGERARVIGAFEEKGAGDTQTGFNRRVMLETRIGGRRVLPPLFGESLPRIC